MICELWKIYDYGTRNRRFEGFGSMELKEVLSNRLGLNDKAVGGYCFSCSGVHAFDLDLKSDEEIGDENARLLFFAACGIMGIDFKNCSAINTGHGIHLLVPKSTTNISYKEFHSALTLSMPKTIYVDKANPRSGFSEPLSMRMPHTYNRKLGKPAFLTYTLFTGAVL